MIDGAVREVILNIINSIVTLPNRILVNLDVNNDYFKTFVPPLGIVRVTVEKAWGFAEESKGKTSRFFSKLTGAAPDCYAKVSVGAEEVWKTKTKSNTTHPAWNETHDFVVTDFDQCIKVDVMDEDVGTDDEVGVAVTLIKDILLDRDNRQELSLVRKGEPTEKKVSIACQYFRFEANSGSFSAKDHKGEGRLCGLVTVLVASAFGIKGPREQLKPSVVVSWGEKHRFQTAIKEDAPGTDINNPGFDQPFRIPLTTDMDLGKPLRIALMNGEKEMGGLDVPFADVQKAPEMTLSDKFAVGDGATVRASICVRGISAANMQ